MDIDIDQLAFAFLTEYHLRVAAGWSNHSLPRNEQKVRFNPDGYATESPGDVRWWTIPYRAIDKVFEIAEAEPFAEALRSLGLPRNLADPASVPWEQLKEFVIREAVVILGDAYREAGSLEISEQHLRNSWARWKDHWNAKTERHRLFVLLADAAGLEQKSLIADGLTVGPFTPELQADIWNAGHEIFGILPLETFSRASTVLEVVGSEDRPLGAGCGPELEIASRAVLALRLSVRGDLSPIGVIHELISPRVSRPSALLNFQGAARRLFSARPHRGSLVTANVCQVASAIYGQLLSLSARNRMAGLELALRRFEQTYTREWREDVLVDLAIVLESTLLADVSGEELKFRTALRGATLLARDSPPAETMHALRRLYDVRSAVVHRGVRLEDIIAEKKYKWLEPDSFLEASEGIVRAVLLAFLYECAAGSTVRAVAEELDQRVLNSLAAR